MKTISRPQIIIPIFLFILLLVAIPNQIVQADVGPKPSMEFIFIDQLNPGPTILSGKLLECEDEGCIVSTPLRTLGPQHFDCEVDTCNSIGYAYSPFHRLQVEFSDGVTRSSNTFTKNAFNAHYLVTIREKGLEVVEKYLGPNTPMLYGGRPTFYKIVALLTFPAMEVVLPIILVVLAIRTGRSGASRASYFRWVKAAWVLAIPAFLAGIFWTRGLIITLVVELLLAKFYQPL